MIGRRVALLSCPTVHSRYCTLVIVQCLVIKLMFNASHVARGTEEGIGPRIISTDEDPSLRIESFVIVDLHVVSTELNMYSFSACKSTIQIIDFRDDISVHLTYRYFL